MYDDGKTVDGNGVIGLPVGDKEGLICPLGTVPLGNSTEPPGILVG